MKVTRNIELDLNLITCDRNVRSDLPRRVGQYWVGKTESNIGLQYLNFKGGRLEARKGQWERKDLLVFQLLLRPHAGFNIFVEPDLSLTWNLFDGTTLTDDEKAAVEIHVLDKCNEPELRTYLEHERDFLESMPWLEVDGMTPEEAVAKFQELGWY